MSKKIYCENTLGESGEFPAQEVMFRPGIYGVVIKDDSVLLLPVYEGYDVPGGGLDIGEPIFEGLKREMKEETGFDIEPKELLEVCDDFFIHPTSKKPFQGVAIYYRCEVIGGELSDEGFMEDEMEYASKAKWVPLKEIDNVLFYNPANNQEIIRKAAEFAK